MGLSAANKFVQGINDVVVLLEQNPHLGKEEPELKAYKRNYRSFVEHRNHKIIYYTSNPQLSSSASFLRLNVLSSLN